MGRQRSQSSVEIFTDGSCDPNPGPGGWAAIIVDGDHKMELSGSESHSTNNRMELTAAIEAIRTIEPSITLKIFTDSQYLQKGVTEWMKNWKSRNWKRKGGELANIDLWQCLSREIDTRKITWKWIKGHNGHPYNERADQLARRQILGRK
jgi:ribonuclease HI